MKDKQIAVIGAGNMGRAIVAGLVKSGFVPASGILIADPDKNNLGKIQSTGALVCENNSVAAQQADVVILAVKPYHIESVLYEIKDCLTPDKIVISIAAGVEIVAMERIMGEEISIFRVMPNTAIALQESLTCISSNSEVPEHRAYVADMFNQLGKTIEIPERLMSAATVLSSCGIAYALRYMRAAVQGGIEIGFGAEMAQLITTQTVKGATELLLQNGGHPETEIDKVTTPGGITITGLNEMENNGFSAALVQGILAAYGKMENR